MDQEHVKAIKASRGRHAGAARSTSGIDQDAISAAKARNKARPADRMALAVRDLRTAAGPKGKARLVG